MMTRCAHCGKFFAYDPPKWCKEHKELWQRDHNTKYEGLRVDCKFYRVTSCQALNDLYCKQGECKFFRPDNK